MELKANAARIFYGLSSCMERYEVHMTRKRLIFGRSSSEKHARIQRMMRQLYLPAWYSTDLPSVLLSDI
jgi:hypothetical protein